MESGHPGHLPSPPDTGCHWTEYSSFASQFNMTSLYMCRKLDDCARTLSQKLLQGPTEILIDTITNTPMVILTKTPMDNLQETLVAILGTVV